QPLERGAFVDERRGDVPAEVAQHPALRVGRIVAEGRHREQPVTEEAAPVLAEQLVEGRPEARGELDVEVEGLRGKAVATRERREQAELDRGAVRRDERHRHQPHPERRPPRTLLVAQRADIAGERFRTYPQLDPHVAGTVHDTRGYSPNDPAEG